MAFLTLIILEIIFAYSCRNLKSNVFKIGIFGNSYMNKSIILLIVIQIIIFISPLKSIFKITSLNILQVLYCIVICIVIFLIDELFKKIISIKFRD